MAMCGDINSIPGATGYLKNSYSCWFIMRREVISVQPDFVFLVITGSGARINSSNAVVAGCRLETDIPLFAPMPMVPN